MRIQNLAAIAVAPFLVAGARAGTPLTVVSTSPPARTTTAGIAAPIEITFDRAVDPATVDASSVWAFGKWSGTVAGALDVVNGGATVRLTPAATLSAGESVMVILSHDLAALDGSPMRAGGYSFQYWTRAEPAAMDFVLGQNLTTRTTPSESSRAYGGVASDMNGDRSLDVTVVNEDTADLRVFLNRADGSGQLQSFIQPTTPVAPRASPSEPSDFDRDGNVDLCVANIDDDSVSIVLGNGDGTFGAQQLIPVGDAPRGIAVLDVDGDGDTDIVNTNSSSSNLSILLNDGNGVFGAPTFYEGGGAGEWALAAADMNEDGLLDLVVGARSSQTLVVNLAQGDGTFVVGDSTSAGGSVWMIMCGDVDGDGHEDVCSANSSHSNGGIVFGDGAGNLSGPTTYPTDNFPLATDFGDLDGDGDLDWVTSSFGGDWFLFENDGTGAFTFREEFLAPQAASCAVLADLDNDRDLDLVLIDELADRIIIHRNDGAPCTGDVDATGAVDFQDLLAVLAAWGPCPAACPSDIDGSGTVDFTDLLLALSSWGPC